MHFWSFGFIISPSHFPGNDLSTASLMRALNQYELNDVNTPIGSPGKESGVITMSNTDFIIEKEPETTPALQRGNYNEDEHKLTTIRKTDIGPAHAIEVNTLAPGKGRYAFSYTPKPFWHNPRIHVMHPPADTWLFMNVTASSEGRTTVHRRLPPSMTSWVVSAFALDPVQGIGLTNPIKKMQTYKEFYITSELPYSVRLGRWRIKEFFTLGFDAFFSSKFQVKLWPCHLWCSITKIPTWMSMSHCTIPIRNLIFPRWIISRNPNQVGFSKHAPKFRNQLIFQISI